MLTGRSSFTKAQLRLRGAAVSGEALARAALLAACFLASVLIVAVERPGGLLDERFEEGEPAPGTVYSPVAFRFVDEEATSRIRTEKSERVLEVFDIDRELRAEAFRKVDAMVELLRDAVGPDSQALAAELPDPLATFSSKDLASMSSEDVETLRRSAHAVLDTVLSRGVMDLEVKMLYLGQGRRQLTVRTVGRFEERTVNLWDMLTLSEARERLADLARSVLPSNRRWRSVVSALAREAMAANLVANPEETTARRKAAYDAVEPVYHEIKRGEMVVQKGYLVTRPVKQRLQEIERHLRKRKAASDWVGATLLVALAFVIFVNYLVVFEPSVFGSLRSLACLLTVMLSCLALEKLVFLFTTGALFYVMLPASLPALLLSILMKPRLGVLAAILFSIFNAVLSRFSPDIIVFTFAGGLVGTYATVGLRRRSQFLRVGALVGLVNFVVLFGYAVLTSLAGPGQAGLYGLVNGLLVSTAYLFFGVYLLEHAFNLATDITLMELSDLNHPLLKRMSVEAPGTYHHSLVMSQLAEAAAISASANPLLARVGSYFHDIGKLGKAEYFTENQSPRTENKHDRLSPRMSTLIITSHIKDGLELARQYKLKDVIKQFIAEHVGTTPVYFFYRKALEQKKADEIVSMDEFRYPGPKPQSKESAIVMLADSVEAASRSLKDTTPESIEQMVRRVINDKFVDEQLSECDLSMTDLNRIAEVFVRSLAGIYHRRVPYPSRESEPSAQERARGGSRSPKPPPSATDAD